MTVLASRLSPLLPSVVALHSRAELSAAIPKLVQLAQGTEMAVYKHEQWRFLLENEDVSAYVVPDDNGQDGQLLGSVLRVAQGGDDAAFGMMLVSPAARGRGLARLLLETAMGDTDSGLRILGTCTELGRPMYEKMGYAHQAERPVDGARAKRPRRGWRDGTRARAIGRAATAPARP
jgi:GNAT superfamily N-acetyltransferase